MATIVFNIGFALAVGGAIGRATEHPLDFVAERHVWNVGEGGRSE